MYVAFGYIQEYIQLSSMIFKIQTFLLVVSQFLLIFPSWCFRNPRWTAQSSRWWHPPWASDTSWGCGSGHPPLRSWAPAIRTWLIESSWRGKNKNGFHIKETQERSSHNMFSSYPCLWKNGEKVSPQKKTFLILSFLSCLDDGDDGRHQFPCRLHQPLLHHRRSTLSR